MTCVQLRKKKHAIKFNISKNLLRKVGISNSLCSRTVKFTIFKRQIKARGTRPAPITRHGSNPADVTCDKLRAVQPGRLLLSLLNSRSWASTRSTWYNWVI